jgi:hypothetical protein
VGGWRVGVEKEGRMDGWRKRDRELTVCALLLKRVGMGSYWLIK